MQCSTHEILLQYIWVIFEAKVITPLSDSSTPRGFPGYLHAGGIVLIPLDLFPQVGVYSYIEYTPTGEKKRNRHHPIKGSRFRILSTPKKPYIARMAIKVHVPGVCGEARAGDKRSSVV